MSKYSIVIPCLNEERYVGKILQCLCDQTFRDFDVTVVDGKSDDRTVQVVESFMDKLNLRIMISEVRSPSYQRNLGAKNSDSDYLLFLDADAYIRHDFLEKTDSQVIKKDPGIFTSWVWMLSDKVSDSIMAFLFFFIYMERVKSIRPGIVGVFIGIKRSEFEEIGGFDETILVAEDFEISHRAHKKGLKYLLMKNPPVWTSPRRMDREGRIKFYLKVIYLEFYTLLKGPVRNSDVVTWEFGKHL